MITLGTVIFSLSDVQHHCFRLCISRDTVLSSTFEVDHAHMLNILKDYFLGWGFNYFWFLKHQAFLQLDNFFGYLFVCFLFLFFKNVKG